MTISTISPGIGLSPVAGSAASIDEQDNATAHQAIGAPTVKSQDSALTVNLSSPIPVAPVVNGLGLGLRFSTDPVTGTAVITVVDVDSGKVVRQIPAEEVLDFMRQFETTKGALISRKL